MQSYENKIVLSCLVLIKEGAHWSCGNYKTNESSMSSNCAEKPSNPDNPIVFFDIQIGTVVSVINNDIVHKL